MGGPALGEKAQLVCSGEVTLGDLAWWRALTSTPSGAILFRELTQHLGGRSGQSPRPVQAQFFQSRELCKEGEIEVRKLEQIASWLHICSLSGWETPYMETQVQTGTTKKMEMRLLPSLSTATPLSYLVCLGALWS